MQNMENYRLEAPSLGGLLVGFVVKVGSGRLGVYIPTLMSDIVQSNKEKERPVRLRSDMVKNRVPVTFSPQVTEVNYVWVRPMKVRNVSVPFYPEGTVVLVVFLDGNIKNGYYLPVELGG